MDPYQVEQIVLGQIDSGERVLWSGAPSPASAALAALPATLFGIPFTAFACFWMWGAWSATPQGPQAGPWSLFPLFGLPFLLIGLGILAAPLWAYLGAGRTVYALTERRALIIGGMLLSRGVQSFARAEIGEIARTERADGSGTVYFATRTFTSSRGHTRTRRIGFVGIPEVRRVEQMIREHLQAQAA